MDPTEAILRLTYPGPMLTAEEHCKIHEVFQRVLEEHRRNKHPLAPLVDDDLAHKWLEGILKNFPLVTARINNKLVGIVCYDIQPFPWGSGSVLQELLTLAVGQEAGFGRVALQVLERIAKEQDCSMILAGNALSINQQLTENLYVHKGAYQYTHQNFIKVL